MSKKISIAIDAMGGDNSPDKTIEGIKIFLEKNKFKNDFNINIFGKEDEIKDKIKKYDVKSKLLNIIHSDLVVSDKETPLTAVKNSKNTSMWNCIQHQIEGKSDISLSAGNTGVLLVISGEANMPSMDDMVILVAMVTSGSLGFFCMTRAVRLGEMSVVSPFRYTRLLFSLAFGVLILDEKVNALMLIGSSAIVSISSKYLNFQFLSCAR